MVNGELSVRNVMQSDSGMYTCVAENKYGTVYSNAELRVLGKYPLGVVSLFLPPNCQIPTLRGRFLCGSGRTRLRMKVADNAVVFSQTNDPLCSVRNSSSLSPDGEDNEHRSRGGAPAPTRGGIEMRAEHTLNCKIR